MNLCSRKKIKPLKIFSLFLSLFLTILLFSCNTNKETEKKIVYPPVRFSGQGWFSIMDPYYDYDTIFTRAEAIAYVRIGNWLKEKGKGGMGSTTYEAEVIETYKGKLPQNIKIVFSGYSKGNEDGSIPLPLPTYGNEFFVFLRLITNEYAYGNFTPDLGEQSFCDVITSENGKKYAVSFSAGGSMSLIHKNTNITNEIELGEELLAVKKQKDPFWNEFPYEIDPCYIFELDELKKIIIEKAKEVN